MNSLDYFLENKNILFGIAYRITGSFADAEDILQETYIKWEKVFQSNDSVLSPKGFLITITSRLSLDFLRKAKRKRQEYIGPYLPEPIPTMEQENEPDLETIEFAFLILLERLNALERAVFILRESFSLEYTAISDIIQKSPENVRQILSRAKKKITQVERKIPVPKPKQEEFVKKFLLAASSADPSKIIPLLQEDIVLLTDGGGKVHAARIPIIGRLRTASVLLRVRANILKKESLDVFYTEANGLPAIVAYRKTGEIQFLQCFQVSESGIQNMYNVNNPEKLTGFQNKEKLLIERKIIPIEMFLLFGRKEPNKWAMRVVNLIKNIIKTHIIFSMI